MNTGRKHLARSVPEKGLGVPKNRKKAVDLYRAAAEQGNPSAQSDLATAYLNGLGIRKDMTNAAFWYRKAAEHNDAVAMNNLRRMGFG